MVERFLAKEEVAGSKPVSRLKPISRPMRAFGKCAGRVAFTRDLLQAICPFALHPAEGTEPRNPACCSYRRPPGAVGMRVSRSATSPRNAGNGTRTVPLLEATTAAPVVSTPVSVSW